MSINSKRKEIESKLEVVYDDDELVVMIAPEEDELKNVIIDLLKERPMDIKEIHSVLTNLASDEKIRKALNELADEGKVIEDKKTRKFMLLGVSN
jgi:predicted transcriptional regulator